MNKPKGLRLIILVILTGIFIGLSFVYYLFNMPRRNISKEKAAFALTAKNLIAEFQKDETAATAKYLDRVIAVTGLIRSIRTLENHNMVFSLEDQMEGVSCTVDSAVITANRIKVTRMVVGSEGKFKGRCSGMLMDIQIIDCVPE